MIVQKTSDLYWPSDPQLDALRAIYGEAQACFFVSEHNRQLTESKSASRCLTRPSSAILPSCRGSLATIGRMTAKACTWTCVGRMQILEKGQDLLLRVLARDRWRKRPLSLTFYGASPNRATLVRIATRTAVEAASADVSAART